MLTARKELIALVNRITEKEVQEILDFALFVEKKRNIKELKNLEMASQTSCDFWNNEIDDEVWNDA